MIDHAKEFVLSYLNDKMSMLCDLFELLLDVCVCLQFELSAGVRPVHQEEPLLCVHLLDQNGCFLVVPHLKMKCVFYFHGPFADFIAISMPGMAQKQLSVALEKLKSCLKRHE